MRAIERFTLIYLLITMLVKGTSTLTRGRFSIGSSKSWALILLMTLLIVQPEKTNAQPPDWIWAKGFGPSRGFGDAYGNSVVVSQGGDVYTTGSFIGNIDFDPGPGIYELNSNGLDAIFISKLDNDGNFVWAKAIGSVVSDYYSGVASSIVVDTTGNIYISSWYDVPVDFDPGPDTSYLSPVGSGDIFIVKLDSSGNFIWVKTIGGISNEYITAISIDTAQNYLFATGLFEETVDFDPGAGTYNLTNLEASDVFILKLDLDGNFVWAKAIGGLSEIESRSIDLDTAGSPIIVGAFWDTSDFDPGTNVFELTSNGAKDIFIAKLDTNGNYVWAKSIGSTGWDIGSDIAVELTGACSIIITGYFIETVDFDPGPSVFNIISYGSGDVYVLKLNYSGNFVWAKRMGGVDNESGGPLTVDQNGNGGIYVTGSFSGLADFDPGSGTYYLVPNGLDDMFISKLNSAGDFVWAYRAGEESWDYCSSIALDPFGFGYITGFFQSDNTTFGSTTLSNIGNSTAFVAKFFACNGIVSNTSDSSRGSLRDAISCSPDNTFITFNLPPMSQITLTSGEIQVDRNLIVLGTGVSDLIISGNNASRIFNLLPGINLNIENLSLKNASSVSNGGALFVKGNLTLKNAILENNFQNGSPKSLTLSFPGMLTIKGDVEMRF